MTLSTMSHRVYANRHPALNVQLLQQCLLLLFSPQSSLWPIGSSGLVYTVLYTCQTLQFQGFRDSQNRLAPHCKLPALGLERSWGVSGTADSVGTAWVSSLSQRKREEEEDEREKGTKVKVRERGTKEEEKEKDDSGIKEVNIWVWCVFECVSAFGTGCQWSVVTVRQALGPQGLLSLALSTSGWLCRTEGRNGKGREMKEERERALLAPCHWP